MTMSTSRSSGPRVAVIGSGLAGLTTAYLLRLRGVTVYLIEKSDKLGFHSSSIDIPLDPRATKNGPHKSSESNTWAVDVPMRSFQGGYYSNLIALYRHLGIPLRPTYFTFSFSHHQSSSRSTSTSGGSVDKDQPVTRPSPIHKPYFIHSGASGQSIPALPSRAFTSPWSLVLGVGRWIAYAGCYLLLLALAAMSYHSLLPCLFSGTLRDTVNQIALFLYHPIPYTPIYTPLGMIWRSFIQSVVIPLFSSVMTTPEADVYSTPVNVILEYVHKTVGVDHYTLAPGYSARSIATILAEPVREQGEGFLRLGATVTDMKYKDGKVMIVLGEDALEVDRAVLATPASVARTFLGMIERSIEGTETSHDGSVGQHGADEIETKRIGVMKKALNQVRYNETIVVTHRDPSVLPASTTDMRNINLVHPRAQRAKGTSIYKADLDRQSRSAPVPHFDPEERYTMATHVIEIPGLASAVYQTTNPMVPIREETVLGIARLERALPLRNPSKTIRSIHPSSGVVYLAGAYAWSGIPLLEGCIGSAKRVVDSIISDLSSDLSGLGSGVESGTVVPRSGTGEDVDWSQGRGGLIGRAWRWRRSEGIEL